MPAAAAMTAASAAVAAASSATMGAGIASCAIVIRRGAVADAFKGMRSGVAAAIPGGGGHLGAAGCTVSAGVGMISEALAASGKTAGGIVAAEILSDHR